MQNNGPCALCSQASEDIHHLLHGCVYNREVWYRLLRRTGLQSLTPALNTVLNSVANSAKQC
jgi:hypothetical protein